MILTHMTCLPLDNPLQNCDSCFLFLLELFYVLESGTFETVHSSLHCLLDIGVINSPILGLIMIMLCLFISGPFSRPANSSGFHNLGHLPLDELPSASRSQSGPVPPRSRCHPKATQWCQGATDQENSGKTAREVSPAFFRLQFHPF